MAPQQQERRLAAVLALDIVGYSRLMGLDEARTLARLLDRRQTIIDPLVSAHRGHVVKGTGDGILAEFASAQDAIRSAIAIQAGLADANAAESEAPPMLARIGVNIGDIIFEPDGDIFGDGVNIAARLEAKAPAGGISVSGRALEELKRVGVPYRDQGKLQLKNIDTPVQVYCIEAAFIGSAGGPVAHRRRRFEALRVRIRSRRIGVALAAVLLSVLVLAGAGYLYDRFSTPYATSLRVSRLQAPSGDDAARMFTQGFAPDLAKVVATGDPTLKVIDNTGTAADGAGADYTLGGSVQTVGKDLRASLTLSDTDGTIIWSTDLSRSVDQAENMHREAEVRVGAVIVCALNQQARDRAVLNVEALKLYLQACELLPLDADDRLVERLQQVVVKAPRFAPGWSLLAIASAFLQEGTEGEERRAGRAATNDAANHALALDPRNAGAWVARAILLEGKTEWLAHEALLKRALSFDPNDPFANWVYAHALSAVGRLGEALDHAKRAADSGPLFAPKTNLVIDTMFKMGLEADADEQLHDALVTWPDDQALLRFGVVNPIRFGSVADAQKAFARATPSASIDPTELPAFRLMTAARAAPTDANKRAAAAYILSLVKDHDSAARALINLGAIGDTDDVYRVLQRYPIQLGDGTEMFFTTGMTTIRADPRFMPLMKRLGIITIWEKTGKWPDFCTAADAPYDCRKVAAQLGR